MIILKVYIANYDNGENWEDHYQWYGDTAYIDKEDCINEIVDNGYNVKGENDCFHRKIDEYDYSYAKVKELKLVKKIKYKKER